MMTHLDELTLSLFAVKELASDQLDQAAGHLSDCRDCSSTLLHVQALDAGLRHVARGALTSALPDDPFGPSDPFRRRPSPSQTRRPLRTPTLDPAEVLAASERGSSLSMTMLDSLFKSVRPSALLAALSLDVSEHRFALLYTLQEAGRQSAENPLTIRDFAQETIDWLRGHRASRSEHDTAERLVALGMLRAHAHLLLASSLLWLKEFTRARAHLIVAYRSFARAGAQELSFALVEFFDSQRRSLIGEGRTARVLASRARETFEAHGMEDYAARAIVGEGLAHFALDEHEEAVRAYRRALPIFERHGLWSNYVGALNSVATSLTKLGRFEEARREYARALRRFAHDRHRYWLGYLRIGFAEALFAAGRFSEAALAASRAESVFELAGQRAHQLISFLLEVESWARHGNLDRARQRLNLFRREVERDHALDPAVQSELVAALSGTNPDYQSIGTLRRRIGGLLEDRYRMARA